MDTLFVGSCASKLVARGCAAAASAAVNAHLPVGSVAAVDKAAAPPQTFVGLSSCRQCVIRTPPQIGCTSLRGSSRSSSSRRMESTPTGLPLYLTLLYSCPTPAFSFYSSASGSPLRSSSTADHMRRSAESSNAGCCCSSSRNRRRGVSQRLRLEAVDGDGNTSSVGGGSSSSSNGPSGAAVAESGSGSEAAAGAAAAAGAPAVEPSSSVPLVDERTGATTSAPPAADSAATPAAAAVGSGGFAKEQMLLERALVADDLASAMSELRWASADSSSSSSGVSGETLFLDVLPPLESELQQQQEELTLRRVGDSEATDALVPGGNSLAIPAFPTSSSLPPLASSLGVFQQRAVRILDLALAEADLTVVDDAYNWLKARGCLPSFGSVRESILDAKPRLVTPDVLKARSGLRAEQLSPKKWGTSTSVLPIATLALFSWLINAGFDIRPLAIVVLVLGLVDSAALGGAGQAQLLSLWPPYRRRVLVHEAGHVLVAYLLGCPVRGVILDAFQAMDLGIQGQAGTQFWDSSLEAEVKAGKLTGASVDRYSVVLFAGIAAEALVFGEAEGGESDENLFKALLSSLQPSWPPPKMSNQARWAVLQAHTMIRENRRALDAVVDALDKGRSMGDLALAIESALARPTV